jgi:flagellar protein FliO/FliZ
MDNFSGQLLNTLGALAFVGLLAWASIAVLKRLQLGRSGSKGATSANPSELRFIRALPLGTKERVVVLHYQGQEWLLGVTAGSISLLAQRPLEQPSPPQNKGGITYEG